MSVSDGDDMSLGDNEEKQEEDYPEDTASKQDEVKLNVGHVMVLMFIIKRNHKTGLTSCGSLFTLCFRVTAIDWEKVL